MRVHHLRISAFGPFAETVEVDGDALSGDGLFLLSGPTGAGKSSVLDAICFALYGAVPGRRNEARSLRCDLAAPDAAPEVVLEVGLGGRRYRFTRSPQWERPKKRGAGTTLQQASVSVQRLDTGADGPGWTHLTHRLDEAGDLVGRLLGMTCTQFCQVAMLPQGEFQTFLQARSDDRQQVLQQLFRTDRYHRIEQWLGEHRRATRREADALARTVDQQVHRVAEAAGGEFPGDDPDLVGWGQELLDGARTEASDAVVAAEAAADALARARSAHDAAQALASARERHVEAVAQRRRLLVAAPAREADRVRLDASHRAAAVAGLADTAAAATGELDRATAARDRALTAAGLDRSIPAPVLGPLVADAERRLDRLGDARPVQAELLAGRAELARTAAATTADEAALTDLRVARAALPGELVALRAEVERLTGLAAGEATADAALVRAEQGVASARRAAALEVDVASARVEEQRALERKNVRHSALITLQEARLSGMAAELAHALAVGQDCPVCGSCDHPSPARPAPDAVDRSTERAARKSLDDAEHDLTAHRDHLRGLEVGLATARAGADDRDPASWTAEADAVRRVLDEAHAATSALPGARDAVRSCEERLSAADERAEALGLRLAALRTEHEAASRAVALLTDRIDALLDGEPDLDTAIASAARARDGHRAALQAVEARDHAADRSERATHDAEGSARAHGFDDLAAARAARLDAAEVGSLRDAEAAHRDAVRDVTVLLADPDLRAAAEAPEPDVAASHVALGHAGSTASAAERRLGLATTRLGRLEVLVEELAAAVAVLEPARARADLAREVADLASGQTGAQGGTTGRLSLPAYVLSWRLGQVVAAANVRLGRMSDGRYVLEHHADAPTRGGRRGGLELTVRDEWSGRSRSPATLSGGETFVVSLALALGLADVVTHEADADAVGADIETLFVDEGFGSLDADTLDDVMAVLDELREGGRAVGVVSHVPDMRERIGTRLEVVKHDRGSRLRLVRHR